MNLEKLLFKKVELWFVCLLGVLAICLAIIFGVIVRSVALGNDRFGFVGRVFYAIASSPSNARKFFAADGSQGMAVGNSNRFPGKRGWQFNSTDDATTPDGYLLFSRYDGDKGMHTIELLDLTSGQVIHRIDIDADTLLDGAARDSKLADFSAWTKPRFRAIHPYPLENGDLIFKDHSAPMLRIDACGNPIWRLENDLYHHTTEIGPEGKLWATTHIEPTRVEGLSEKYYDDGIVAFSADGKILYDRSLTEVLLKQGYSYKLFTNAKFNTDPIHLNDVQPILTDGPYWKSGDLLLSLRHMSTLALFRPSTDEIIWMKQGPWSGQHDVDVINDTTIGVFNNNMLNMGKGDYVNGNSDILFYDFATDTVTSPYKDLFEKYQIRTASEGLFTLLPTGHLLIEEAEAGRFLIFSPDGTLVAEHVNRAQDGLIYRYGWSRFIERATGDRLRDAMNSIGCN